MQKYLDWIFCYLDRAYLLPRHESLREISIDLFRSIIFDHPKLNKRIVDGACDLVAADRTVGDLDSEIFSKTVNMFHDMQVYTKHFEPQMMSCSQDYIMQWSDAESAEKSLPEYVRNARELMDREMKRVEMFSLPNTTKRDLLTLLEDLLISRKEARLSTSLAMCILNPDDSDSQQLAKTNSPTFSKPTQWKILKCCTHSSSGVNWAPIFDLAS